MWLAIGFSITAPKSLLTSTLSLRLITPLLKEIKVPVLYVFGEKDSATPLYMADILHKGTKDSGLAVMKGTTHFCFCEQPDLFNAIAREFFKTGEIVK